MLTKWSQHITNDVEKKEFQRSVQNAKPVLERIVALLDERERTLDSQELDFSSPSWSHLAASIAGRRSEIRSLKKFLTLDHKEDK